MARFAVKSANLAFPYIYHDQPREDFGPSEVITWTSLEAHGPSCEVIVLHRKLWPPSGGFVPSLKIMAPEI